MADHVRTQCRDAVVSLLGNLTTTTTHVYAARPGSKPLQEAELPGLIVYTNETGAEDGSGQRGARRLIESCELVVEGYARSTGDVDKTLDTIEKEVRAAIGAAPTLSGKAKDTLFVGSEKEHDTESEKPTWRIRIRFGMEYHTLETAPDAPLT